MKRSLLTIALVALTSSLPGAALGAACPGTYNGVMSYTAFRGGAGTATIMFRGGGCSSVAVGAALGCANIPVGSPTNTFVRFGAYWANTMARTTDPSGGCSFMCPGGNCFVRGLDALPIELLSFGVE